MRKYSAKELTRYAENIGFNEPRVWYNRNDGWWLESDQFEEYLGADSRGARSKLVELCEGDLNVDKQLKDHCVYLFTVYQKVNTEKGSLYYDMKQFIDEGMVGDVITKDSSPKEKLAILRNFRKDIIMFCKNEQIDIKISSF